VVHRCFSCAWSVFGSVILNLWCMCTVRRAADLFNSVFPPSPKSSRLTLPSCFSSHNSVCFCFLSQAFHKLRPSLPPFNSPKNAWWGVLSWGPSLSTFLQPHVISSIFSGNIFNTVASNLRPCHSVIWQTKFYIHTTRKIVVLQQYTEAFLNLITLDCTTPGPFRVTAGSVATTAVPVYQDSGSTSFNPMHLSYY